jgi:hypothetical protein
MREFHSSHVNPALKPATSPAASLPADLAFAAIAIIAGALAWIIPAQLSGHREAWDGRLWWVWLLSTGLAALALGFAAPRRWWLWPILLMAAQFAAMMIQSKEVGALTPLGFILMAVIAGVLMLPAFVGAKLRPVRTPL